MRLGKDSKAAAIARVPLFARCSKGELGRIAQIADEVDLPAGYILTKEGTRGREFFVLLEGTADVRRGGREISSLKGGDFLGEIALVTNVARTATVKTTSPVRALVITDRAFRELLRTSPEIQGKVLEAIAARLAASLWCPFRATKTSVATCARTVPRRARPAGRSAAGTGCPRPRTASRTRSCP